MSLFRIIFDLVHRLVIVIADHLAKEYFTYSWLMAVLFTISLGRYLSVDINRLIQPLLPDYGFLEYAAYNSFKRTEIIRYVLTCGVLFGLFVSVGLLRKVFAEKICGTRTIRVTSLLATLLINIAMTYYNSHATTTIFLLLCIVCILAIMVPLISAKSKK